MPFIPMLECEGSTLIPTLVNSGNIVKIRRLSEEKDTLSYKQTRVYFLDGTDSVYSESFETVTRLLCQAGQIL